MPVEADNWLDLIKSLEALPHRVDKGNFTHFAFRNHYLLDNPEKQSPHHQGRSVPDHMFMLRRLWRTERVSFKLGCI